MNDEILYATLPNVQRATLVPSHKRLIEPLLRGELANLRMLGLHAEIRDGCLYVKAAVPRVMPDPALVDDAGELHRWVEVAPDVDRMRVPGGWIYRDAYTIPATTTFVPNPRGDL